MFRKFATLQVLEAFEVPQRASRRALRKAAHRVTFDYEPRPGYLYVRSRAISSRCNDNYDEFPAEEIKKAYRTFIGKPVFVNHHNDDHRRARGVIIDAALHEDRNADGTPDTWTEVLMEVDARNFPKLAKAILAGEVDRTSMGCDVKISKCSACGNKATNPAEYCHHIPAMKGQRIFRVNASTGKREGHLVREICYGLGFFENSLLVEEPADPTAYTFGVDDRGLKMAASQRKTAAGWRATHRQYSGTHCLMCGDPVMWNSNPAKQDLPSGGWYHEDSQKRDHLPLPADPDAVMKDRARQDAYRDQLSSQVREQLGLQRRHKDDLPPDPFEARRKTAISDEEIQRGLNLPKAEDTHDEVTKMKGKDLAESWLKPLYEPYGGEENYRLHQANESMMALKRRYEGGTGKFGFDSEDDGGEPYYEVRHPSGWTIRHYSDGPMAEIRHRATQDESHQVFDIGDDTYNPNGQGILSGHDRPPENFGHQHLKKILHDWYNDDGPEPTGAREYLEANHPKIRRWKRTMGMRKRADAAHKVWIDTHAGTGRRSVSFADGGRGEMVPDDGQWYGENEHGEHVLTDRDPKRVLRALADHYGLTDALDVEHRDNVSGRKQRKYLLPPSDYSPTYEERESFGPGGQEDRGGAELSERYRRKMDTRSVWPYGEQDYLRHSLNSKQADIERFPEPIKCLHCGKDVTPEMKDVGGKQVPYVPFGDKLTKEAPICYDCMSGDPSGKGGKPPAMLPKYPDRGGRQWTDHLVKSVDEGKGRLFHPDDAIRQSLNSRHQAGIKDVVAPPDVDTLRDEECPVCAETEVYDGERCPICGFVAPPAMFRDPDLDMAKQVDLRQEQQDDNTIAPGQMNPDEPGGGLIDPSQLGDQPVGSFQDAQNQLQHPDQLVPDGVPTQPPGTPGDGVPDLFCPACGYSMDAGTPMTTTTDNPEAPSAEGPEEGMPCPNCGQATMLSISDAEQGGLLSPDQLPGADGDQSGQLMNPDDLPPDQQGQEGVPGEEGTEESTPDEENPDGEQVDPDADQDDSLPDQGDSGSDGDDDDDAVDDEDPAKKKREQNSKGAVRMSKAVEAAVAAQTGVIDSLTRKVAALEAQNAFLAKLAGVEKEFAVIKRHADINNPASPIPDPPEEQAYETTEEALAPETMDNPQNPGTTPGSVNHVPAEQTATPMDPGMTMPTSPANQLVDVTAPVAGTNTGEVPLEQRRIETDVRIGEDPLRETGPGLGGVGNNGTAFPWTMSSAGASNRTMASLRLAKLQIAAGLTQGDEFTVASKIETDASLPDVVIADRIRMLETMTANAKRVAPRKAAGLVPKAARSAPSMASMASARTASVEDTADFELFLDA